MLEHVFGFEMDALDLVIEAATFDGRPIHDASSAGDGVAHVALLEDFLKAGAGLAIGNEFIRSELGAAGAIDDIQQPELDGIDHGDAVIQIPWGLSRAGLLGELVEESILAFMS